MRWSDKQAAWAVAAVHEFAFGTKRTMSAFGAKPTSASARGGTRLRRKTCQLEDLATQHACAPQITPQSTLFQKLTEKDTAYTDTTMTGPARSRQRPPPVCTRPRKREKRKRSETECFLSHAVGSLGRFQPQAAVSISSMLEQSERPRWRKVLQAWRATGWWPDHYSIAIFDITKVRGGSKLKFTQIGIPPSRYSGHYGDWIETYWTPMREIFATGAISDKTRGRVKIDREQRIRTGKFRRKISGKA